MDVDAKGRPRQALSVGQRGQVDRILLVHIQLLNHAGGDAGEVVPDDEGKPLMTRLEQQLHIVTKMTGEDSPGVGVGDASVAGGVVSRQEGQRRRMRRRW
jgi:hypothetical protein